MKTIEIHNQNSRIYIGESYKNLKKYLPKKQIILITDKNVFKHYKDYIQHFSHIIIGTGEKEKSWKTVKYIINQLLDLKADRNSYLIGFGGGLVCDITGFVASVFMRGVDFGFVSTTLLAQVDASIGGKNGINFQQYKNMIGVFNAPDFVICDPIVLRTLPDKEIKSGFGEVIKHALIKDNELFNYLTNNYKELLQLSAQNLEDVIYNALNIKISVVSEDFKEKGVRKILNFGHTLGHAIENNSQLTHGEAIAVGMVFAVQLSVVEEFMTIDEAHQIKQLIQKFELPVNVNISGSIIWDSIIKDKKKIGDKIYFVLLKNIGEAHIKKMSLEYLKAEIFKEFS